MNRDCAIFVVMGKTEPDAPTATGSRSMVLVPRDTPGVQVRRGLSVFGYDETHGGHAEVAFDDVRVPARDLIGERGHGFAIAQARLGPGRIHHCMRLIGMAERAIELMCRRALHRVAFGRPLAEQGVVREWIADSRVRLEQLRLLVLQDRLADRHRRRAEARDRDLGHQDGRAGDGRVGDRQGDPGPRRGRDEQDTPLAMLWAQARALRFADGPDEVHRMVLARRELERYRT